MKLPRILINCLWGGLSLLFTLTMIGTALMFILQLGLPSVASLKDVHMQVPLRIYSQDNKLMGEFGIKRRIPVTLDQIPKPLIHAVLATEDARFYEHSGVDFISLARAAKAVIKSGKKVQGASTITMQVARNFFLNRKKTYIRKLHEIILAMKIDHELSKDKILELYLNKIYFGNRAYGIAAAAQVYYGTSLNQLTLAQMAMLAGLPQAPSAQNPIRHPKAALARRNHVLVRMLKVGYIDQDTYEETIQKPITASYHHLKIGLHAPYVTELIRRKLFAKYGDSIYEKGWTVHSTVHSRLQQAAEQAIAQGAIAYSKRHGFFKAQLSLGLYSPDDAASWQQSLNDLPTIAGIQPVAVINIFKKSLSALTSDGSTITINWPGLRWARPYRAGKRYPGRKPKQCSDIVSPGDVIYVASDNQGNWELSQMPQVQSALVSMNPNNGNVLALVGGLNYQTSHFNRATQALRQPGSNFKPFVYAAALAHGMSLSTMINDAPVVMQDSGENKLWRPQNDTLKFYGPTSLRMGLIKSRNVVSIRVLQNTGLNSTLNYIKNFGFDVAKLPHSLSLALGSGGVSPMILARGYSVFANGGYLIRPHLIDTITDTKGNTVYQTLYPTVPTPTTITCASSTNCNATTHGLTIKPAAQTISSQVAYLMTNALQGVIQQGTGRRARILKRQDLAGKTGTTNNQVDAWFSGYNNQIETTVWLGFDNSQRSLYEYAASSALPIWIDYMKTALQGMTMKPTTMPNGLVSVRIDPSTGLLASANSPHAAFELFRKAYAPTQYSNNAQTTAQQDIYGATGQTSTNTNIAAPLF